MALSVAEKERLSGLVIPGTDETIAAVRDYMAHADLNFEEFATRIGYRRSTFGFFLRGKYVPHVASTDTALRAAAWEYMRRFPVVARVRSRGQLFETKNVQIMRAYFEAAVERGEVCLIYGPPGTQKTFTLEHLVAERNRLKKNDALYVYASADMAPLALMKRLGREAGVCTSFSLREKILSNLIDCFSRCEKAPAVVVDEAQHLTVACLEVVRELHDRSGCGLVLAGSHDLYEKFLKSRAQLEQWLSRIDHKEPLPGLLEDEIGEIAARELGNGHPAKLSEKQIQALVVASRVDDVFARGADGRPSPAKYLSVRRLVKVLAQAKTARSARGKEKAS
jgi:DNA transposition AAA+ family ATPase